MALHRSASRFPAILPESTYYCPFTRPVPQIECLPGVPGGGFMRGAYLSLHTRKEFFYTGFSSVATACCFQAFAVI